MKGGVSYEAAEALEEVAFNTAALHYQNVYVADVSDSEVGSDQRFRRSEWSTRGWTLQELIAPMC